MSGAEDDFELEVPEASSGDDEFAGGPRGPLSDRGGGEDSDGEVPDEDEAAAVADKGAGRGRGRGQGGRGGGAATGGGGRGRKGNYKSGPGRKSLPKTGTRQCQGCFKHRPADLFPAGSKYEVECKRALDCIYKSCERQTQLDWYYEQTGMQEKMKKLLAKYFEIHPVTKKMKRPPIKLLQLKESVKVSTMVDRDDLNKMMHEEAFVHFAVKPKNLGMTDPEARLEFKRLCKLPDAILDEDGPKHSRNRCAVNTEKLVIFRNRIEKSRSYSLEEKVNKKPTQEHIDKAYSSIQQHHDTIGCASGAGTMLDMAGWAMRAKTAGETWSGINVSAPDATALRAELRDEELEPVEGNRDHDQDEDEDAAGDDTKSRRSYKSRGSVRGGGAPDGRRRASSGHGDDGSKGGPTPTKGVKKARWFDRDTHVADTHRTLKKRHDNFVKGLRELVNGASKVTEELEQKPAVKPVVQNERAILDNRVNAARWSWAGTA